VTPYSTDGALRAFQETAGNPSGVDCKDDALNASFKHGTDVRLYRVKSVQQRSQRSWGSSIEATWRGSGTALWEEES